MHFVDKLALPGEHPMQLNGSIGAVEAVFTVPPHANKNYIAIIGHPHSLQGGTMNNKVVTTLVRVFKELHIASLRFNFRGVGTSEGAYDDGVGESEDMLVFAKAYQQQVPEVRFIFAGFSFGSYVAYRAAAATNQSQLITIAPPVHHYDYTEFQPDPFPWLIVQGLADEVVPANLVEEFAKEHSPPLPVIEFADTGHFFHGKLLELKDKLIDYMRPQVTS
ncbi:MAG: hypothetical protein WC627_10480 [Legionella sp.]|jgi:hypothetical protein